MRKLALSLLLLVCALFASAQTSFNRHYTLDDGLSSNTVYCVTQDSKGYLWFGTDQGVCRFNGRSFVRYSISDGLTDRDVLQIKEDSDGRLWMLTYNGVPCYFQNGRFHHPDNTPMLKEIAGSRYMSALEEDEDGTIYLAFASGMLYSIEKGDSVSVVSRHPGYNERPIANLWLHNGYLFGGYNNFLVFNYSKRIAQEILPEDEERMGPARFFFEDERLYQSVGNQINVFSERLELIHRVHLKPDEQVQFLGSGYHSSQISVGTNYGLRFLEKGSNALSAIQLPGKTVTNLANDHEGGMWVSTLNAGVFYAQSQSIVHFTQESIPDVPVHSLAYFRDTVWFGTSNLHFGKIVGDSLTGYEVMENRNSLAAHRRILDIFPIKNRLYFRAEKGLIEYAGNEDKPAQVPSRSITSYCVDSAGVVWVGGLHGMTTLSKTFEAERGEKLNYVQYRMEVPVFHLMYMADHAVYCGTTDGVYRVDLDAESFELIFPETRKKKVTGMALLGENRIAVATAGWGLYLYDGDSLAAHFVPQQEKLPAHINRLRQDSIGKLWFATNSGIYHMQPTKKHFSAWKWQHFNEENGLISNHVNDLCFVHDRLYTATSKGLAILDTTQLSRNQAPPVFGVWQISTAEDTVLGANRLLLAESSTATVHCDVISYSNKKLLYRYRINKGDWIKSASDQFTIAALNPGLNTLEMSVRSSFSRWSEPQSIQLIKQVPWWQAGWVKWSVGVLVLGFFYLILRLKIVLFDNRLLLNYLKRASEKALGNKYLTLKTSTEVVRVNVETILWVKAEANYCVVVTQQRKVMFLSTLKAVEEMLAKQSQFMRVHRSYLINLRHVSAAKSTEVMIADQTISVGATYRNQYRTFLDSFKA